MQQKQRLPTKIHTESSSSSPYILLLRARTARRNARERERERERSSDWIYPPLVNVPFMSPRLALSLSDALFRVLYVYVSVRIYVYTHAGRFFSWRATRRVLRLRDEARLKQWHYIAR